MKKSTIITVLSVAAIIPMPNSNAHVLTPRGKPTEAIARPRSCFARNASRRPTTPIAPTTRM